MSKSASKRIELRQATSKHRAAAQVKAWREAAGELRAAGEESRLTSGRNRGSLLKNMEAEAAAAEQKLQKVDEAGKRVHGLH